MNKSEFVIIIFKTIPSVVSTYFGMLASGNPRSILGALLGLIGIVYIIQKFFGRWIKAIIMSNTL